MENNEDPNEALETARRGCGWRGRRRSRNWRSVRYWRNLVLFTLFSGFLGYLFLVYVGHPYFLSKGWAHPNSPPVCCQTPADAGLAYEEVAFNTRDGLTLRGWAIPSQNGAAIILSHPIGANRLGSLAAAVMLARHGYGVLLLDLRSHGESDGDLLPFGGPEGEDIRAAATYLDSRSDVNPGKVGAMGFSLGAQVSLIGATQTDLVKAVVADGACCTTFEDMPAPKTFDDWRFVPYDLIFFPMLHWRTGVAKPLSLQEAVAQIAPRPVLLIGSGSEQRLVEHHYQAAKEPKTMWIIPEAGHIGGMAARPEEYEMRVVGFFDRALLGD